MTDIPVGSPPVPPGRHAAPGGWYADPLDRGKERYWDGWQWSRTTRDLEPRGNGSAPAPGGPQPYPGPQSHPGNPQQPPYGTGPEGQSAQDGSAQGRQNPYGQDPYGQNPYGEGPRGQGPYGQAPQGPYGQGQQNPYGQNPYGQGQQGPYGQAEPGQPPYGQGQGQQPYGPGGYPPPSYGPGGSHQPGAYGQGPYVAPGGYLQNRPGAQAVATADGVRLAGWWYRVLAMLVDSILVSLIAAVPSFPVYGRLLDALRIFVDETTRAAQTGQPPPTAPSATSIISVSDQLLLAVIIVVVGLVYHSLFLRFKQATPGKMLCHLRVVPVDQGRFVGPLPWSTVLVRAAIWVLPGLQLYLVVFRLLDALFPLWHPKRQAVHDLVAKTQVVRPG